MPGRAKAAEPFELMDGERVVLLGNTLIERDQKYGYLETALTSRWPDRNITFRNLGWSGDTVWGDARAGFDNAEKGFERLKELVLANKPTTIFVSYGTNEAFAGEKGLPEFQKGLDRLLDAISESKARIVIISPIKQAPMRSPLPNPDAHNEQLKLYCEALRNAAEKRGTRYVDLFQNSASNIRSPHGNMTDDGLHLTPDGYFRFAEAIESQLQLPPFGRDIEIQSDGKVTVSKGTLVEKIQGTPKSGAVSFVLRDERLPSCPWAGETTGFGMSIVLKGLPPGNYLLRIDGNDVETGSADNWSRGISRHSGKVSVAHPEHTQIEKLRAAINAKNQLYFYRWRPQNETYLFGFRKHEQGKNAAEVVQFDPLIAEKEAEIAKLRVPQPHVYELVREPDEKKNENK